MSSKKTPRLRRLRSTRRRLGNDRGAVIIFFAFVIVALLIVTALVVDLGMARETKRRGQSDADFAALAAAWYLAGNGSLSVVSDPRGACNAAVNSIATNVDDWPAAATADMTSQCAAFPQDAAVCSSTTIYSAVSTNADPYVLTIKWPVPDSEISRSNWNGSASAPASGLGSEDGNPCERMSVSLQRDDPAIFAGVLGSRGQTLTASAVGRGTVDEKGTGVPALLLLQRTGCGALQVSGQGAVHLLAGSNSIPGTAHTDTSALTSGTNACTTNNNAGGWGIYGTQRPSSVGSGPSIMVDGVAGRPGIIQSYARTPAINGRAGYYFDPACNWGTGSPVPASCINSGLSVAPTGGRIVSRLPVDNKYGDNIAALHNTARALTAGAAPAGYTVVGNNNNPTCNLSNQVIQEANVYVNCDSFTGDNVVFRGTHIIFKGKFATSTTGYLAFPNADWIYARGCTTGCGSQNSGNNYAWQSQGMISVNTGESVPGVFNYTAQLNAGTAPATWGSVDCVTKRAGPGAGGTNTHATVLASFSGPILVQNGTLNLCQTAVYVGSNTGASQTTGNATGAMTTYSRLQITSNVGGPNCSVGVPCPLRTPPDTTQPLFALNPGSSGAISWTAPNLSTGGVSASSPFEDLALWTEGVGDCSFSGQAALVASGVFFHPNCGFNYAGQTDNSNPLNAQFIGYSLNLSGQGILKMRPNPDDAIPIPIAGSTFLIR
jgi:Flp pilus assembly protein TadG